jgi:hypothetical protein
MKKQEQANELPEKYHTPRVMTIVVHVPIMVPLHSIRSPTIQKIIPERIGKPFGDDDNPVFMMLSFKRRRVSGQPFI